MGIWRQGTSSLTLDSSLSTEPVGMSASAPVCAGRGPAAVAGPALRIAHIPLPVPTMPQRTRPRRGHVPWLFLATLVVLATLLVPGFVLPGHAADPSPTPSPTASSSSSAGSGGSATATIKVAVVVPTSDLNTEIADMARVAIEAVDLSRRELPKDPVWGPLMTKFGVQFDLLIADTYQANSSATAFPGHTFSPVIPETAPAQAVLATLDVVQRGAVGIVGEVTSRNTLAQALVSSRLQVPQCSFSAVHPELSNKKEYPMFFRTIAAAAVYARAFLELMDQMKWHRFALLSSMDAFGSGFAQSVGSIVDQLPDFEMTRITFWENGAASDMDRPLQDVLSSSNTVILVGSVNDPQRALIKHLAKASLLGRPDLTWVFINNMTDAVVDAYDGKSTDFLLSEDSPALGTFVVSVLGDLEGLKSFVDFTTNLVRFTGHDITNNEAQAYMCGQLLFRMLLQYINGAPPGEQASVAAELASGKFSRGPIDMNTLNSIKAVGPHGLMQFDSNLDLLDGYEILNWQRDGLKTIYRKIDTFAKLADPIFSGRRTEVPQDASTYLNVNISPTSAFGLTVEILSSVGILLCFLTWLVILAKRRTPTIRAISPVFCSLVLLGLACIYATTALHLLANTTVLCNVTPALAVLGIALVLCNIIAKNQRIWQLFGSPLMFRKGLPDSKILRLSVVLIAIDAVLVALWIALSPFRYMHVYQDRIDYHVCLPMTNLVTGAEPGVIRLGPNKTTTLPSLYESPVFLVICVYNGALVLYGALLAWNTRTIPLAGYSESKAIALCTYNILLGGAVLLPTFFPPLNADYVVSYSIRLVILLFCATFALFAFFFPPLYTLWLNRNTPPGLAVGNKPTGASMGGTGLGRTATASIRSVDADMTGVRARRAWAAAGGDTDTIPAGMITTGPNVAADPAPGCETLEGQLIVKKSHRILSGGRLLGRFLTSFERWRTVRVTVLPHLRLITMGEVSEGPPVFETFQFLAVLGPADHARARARARSRDRATKLLPSRRFYETNASATGMETFGTNGGGTGSAGVVAGTPGSIGPAPSVLAAAAGAASSKADLASPTATSFLPPSDLHGGTAHAVGHHPHPRSSTGNAAAHHPPVRYPSDMTVTPTSTMSPTSPTSPTDRTLDFPDINWCEFVVRSAFHNFTFHTETREQTDRWVHVLRQALIVADRTAAGGNASVSVGARSMLGGATPAPSPPAATAGGLAAGAATPAALM
ncbi:Metabotropic GABA-B receptor subtype 3A [Allomyces arbusculus]|nr:Metabotropic GABA-B receptor subtype 3A [Allomyces arbusculus]